MSHFETTVGLNSQQHRYERIESANNNSFYMNDSNRPFNVILSIQGAGTPRTSFETSDTPDTIAEVKKKNSMGRYALAGNMSTVNQLGPKGLSVEDRIIDAEKSMDRFIRSLAINPHDVRLLNPDRDYNTPMNVVNIDEQIIDPVATGPVRVDTRGDFIYTYNPDIALGVRPADCPLVVASAETPDGRIYMMVHFAWRGAASPGNGVSDMATEFDTLGVNRDTLQIYITPGGQAETFSYNGYPQDPHQQYPGTEKLFLDVTKHNEKYSFGIDTPHFIYENLLDLGIDKTQIFVDTSDTSALNSGYSSHGRSSRLEEDNNRDLVIVQFNK